MSAPARPSLRALPLVYPLLLVMVLLFPALDLWEESQARLVRAGALYRPLVRAGDWWRLLTYGFLHGGLAHIISNGYALHAMGPGLERLYGRARLLCLFLLAVAAGGVVSTLAHRQGVAVGASAGVFGLLGANIVLGVRLWPRMTFSGQRSFVQGTVVVLALNGGLALMIRNIDHAAHAGGLLCGALLAAPWRLSPEVLDPVPGPPPPIQALPGSRLWAVLAGLCLLVALYGALQVVRLQRDPWAFGTRDFQGAGLRVRALRCFQQAPAVEASSAEGAPPVLRLDFPGLTLRILRVRGGSSQLGERAAAQALQEVQQAQPAQELQDAVTSRDPTGDAWLRWRGEGSAGQRLDVYARAAGADVLLVLVSWDPAQQALAPPAEVWTLVERIERSDD